VNFVTKSPKTFYLNYNSHLNLIKAIQSKGWGAKSRV